MLEESALYTFGRKSVKELSYVSVLCYRITDVLGYEEKELCDNSMYALVHVEDLHTLVTVHKSSKFSPYKQAYHTQIFFISGRTNCTRVLLCDIIIHKKKSVKIGRHVTCDSCHD